MERSRVSQITEEGADLAWGVEEIARTIGRTPRQTYHLLERGQLPAKKLGNKWVGSRRKLLTHLTGEPA